MFSLRIGYLHCVTTQQATERIYFNQIILLLPNRPSPDPIETFYPSLGFSLMLRFTITYTEYSPENKLQKLPRSKKKTNSTGLIRDSDRNTFENTYFLEQTSVAPFKNAWYFENENNRRTCRRFFEEKNENKSKVILEATLTFIKRSERFTGPLFE